MRVESKIQISQEMEPEKKLKLEDKVHEALSIYKNQAEFEAKRCQQWADLMQKGQVFKSALDDVMDQLDCWQQGRAEALDGLLKNIYEMRPRFAPEPVDPVKMTLIAMTKEVTQDKTQSAMDSVGAILEVSRILEKEAHQSTENM